MRTPDYHNEREEDAISKDSEEVEFGQDFPVNIDEVQALRRAVGWPIRGDYAKILKEGLFHISAHLRGRLIGFVNVVDSPHGDHLIQDLLTIRIFVLQSDQCGHHPMTRLGVALFIAGH